MTPRHAGPEHGGSAEDPRLSQAQRKAVADADPDSGRVRAGAPTLRRLADLGLALPHGRLGDHYLTGHGRTLRERLCRPEFQPPPGTTDHAFVPATGDGPPSPAAAGTRNAAASAWRSLMEIRRLTRTGGAGDPLAVPAAWERARPVHAVALALQAAGLPASAVDPYGWRVTTGYRVTEAGGPGTVRVQWQHATGPAPEDGDLTRTSRERLADCARVLQAAGWQTERYLDTRRRPYLLAVACPHR